MASRRQVTFGIGTVLCGVSTVLRWSGAEAPLPHETFDVIVVDADSIPIKSDPAAAWKTNAPIIALIGTETPSRLKWLLDLKPASFLVKPLRSAGLYTALVVAFDCAQQPRAESLPLEVRVHDEPGDPPRVAVTPRAHRADDHAVGHRLEDQRVREVRAQRFERLRERRQIRVVVETRLG